MTRADIINFPILRFMFSSLTLILTTTATRLTFYMNAPTAIRASRYLLIVIRWFFIAAVIFAASKFVCGYVINHVLPQVYTAKATLTVPANDLVIPTAGSSPEPEDFRPEFENTIRSPDFLLAVIKDLGLEQAWAKRLYRSDDQLPDVDALTHMENALKFRIEPEINTISITAASDVPQEAADIANAVADRYKTTRDVAEAQREDHGDTGLREQIAEQQKVVDDKKATLEKMPPDQSPAYLAAQHDLDQQQSILDALDTRDMQGDNDSHIAKSLIHFVSRAETPIDPTHPNKSIAYYLTLFVATSAGLVVASFVEIIFLFLRASERMDN